MATSGRYVSVKDMEFSRVLQRCGCATDKLSFLRDLSSGRAQNLLRKRVAKRRSCGLHVIPARQPRLVPQMLDAMRGSCPRKAKMLAPRGLRVGEPRVDI